jgi:hypothetical protein
VAVCFLERDAPNTEIRTVFDAFYFTTVQLLTVSSSLKNPLSTGGRVRTSCSRSGVSSL